MKHIARCEQCGRLFLVEYPEFLGEQQVTHREGSLRVGDPEGCGPVHHDYLCILVDQGEVEKRWDREEQEDELEEIL